MKRRNWSSKNPSKSKRREEVKARRRARVLAGLCRYCDELAIDGTTMCQRHREAKTQHRHSAKTDGRCHYCGNPAKPGKWLCEAHGIEQRKRIVAWRKERIVKGVCGECGKNPPEGKHRKCKPCKERCRNYAQKIKKERLDAGLCLLCGKIPPIDQCSRCKRCYFKEISGSNFGTVSEAKSLDDLFDAQNSKCPFTGEQLVIGRNVALDHIIPVSRGGAVDDIGNVQWVHKIANDMKGKLTDQEFLGMVAKIASHRLGMK